MDRLSDLLARFSVHAGVFHSGSFCGITAFDGKQTSGHLHLLRAGQMLMLLGDGREVKLERPSLFFCPRPYRHRLLATETDQTELVCASLTFDGGSGNPLATALPDYLLLPLDAVPMLAPVLDWLFTEAFGERCGRVAVMNRLFELLVIELLRHLLDSRSIQRGMLAGLADPRLARALHALHARPEHGWRLETLAQTAGMSRARFSAHFHATIGQTPGDYLLGWRISLAQQLLREGQPISLVAGAVGYDSASALARVFRRQTGSSPRDWLRAQQAGPAPVHVKAGD
ncbi:AraC family transcriptional regulator [Chitinimonas naiadis]